MFKRKQAISADLRFKEKIYKWFESKELKRLKDEYKIVGIIGAQGTGKSTFCNHVFDTDFQVQGDEDIERTTTGVWFSINTDLKILVMDTEGTDSNQRDDDDYETFERVVTCFTLSMSDVLLINIKWEEVERK